MSDLPAPPVIDYTSRDYASIRDDLLGLIPQFLPDWVSRSRNDFGIVLLELYAAVADGLHYYADRIANEAYLDTATQRGSVIRLARMLGYNQSNAIAATTTLTITNSTAGALVVPARSQVSTSTDSVNTTPVTFETDADVTVPANSTATVTASEGVTTTDTAYSGTGETDQSFQLFDTSVIQGSVSIAVTTGSSTSTWTYVDRLLVAGPYDNSYTLLTDENGIVTVQFGDGANGAVVPAGATVVPTYRVGGGIAGNVASGTLKNFVSNVPAGLSVTNLVEASGGADEESTESIRQNAARSIVTVNRAVTLDDYANLATQVSGCARASAASSTPTSVTVYVAPQGGGGYESDGTTANATLTSLISNVSTFLAKVKPAPTTVTVQGPSYVKLDITVNIHVAPTYDQAQAKSDAEAALLSLLSFDSVIFADQITPADVFAALFNIPGIIYPDLTVLAESGGGTVGVVTLATNQIPIAGNIVVDATGGVS